MPAGNIFGGFAQTVGQGLMQDQLQREQDERDQRKMQFELLMKQANDPSLRPELRPTVMAQITKLAGMDFKGKKKAEFDAGLNTILGILGQPQQIQTTERQQVGSLPSAAMTTGGVLPKIQATGIPGTPEYIERATGTVTPPLPGQANIAPSPIIQDVTKTRTVSPFMSPQEMQDIQLRQYEAQRKIQQKYDLTPDKIYDVLPQVFIGKNGERYGNRINKVTGQTERIPLGSDETIEEFKARTAAEAKVKAAEGRDVASLNKKLEQQAIALAVDATGDPNAAKNRAIWEKYLPAAAHNMTVKGDLDEEATRALISYRQAGATGIRANLPMRGQPNVPAQRQFQQDTARVSEIQRELGGLKQRKDYYGKQLKDGTTIERPKDGTDAERDRVKQQMNQYRKELNDEMMELRVKRGKTASVAGIPTREDATSGAVEGPPMPSGPVAEETKMAEKPRARIGRINPTTGKPWARLDVVKIKGKTWIIDGPPDRNGNYPVVENK